MVVHYLEVSCTIIYPPVGVDSTVGPQLAVVTLE